LLRSGPADILLTHEAPAVHPHGWRAINELAEALGVQVVVHGHHHQNIDYVGEGLMTTAAPFRAFGVDMGSHLAWPRDEPGPGGPLQDVLDLATQVFGAAAQAWLDKPHELLDGQTPVAHRWPGATWGILRSDGAEFLVPDNAINVAMIPVSPTICLVLAGDDRNINPMEVAQINRLFAEFSYRYYFARDLDRCPIHRRTIPRIVSSMLTACGPVP
jgi:hypothetical protein